MNEHIWLAHLNSVQNIWDAEAYGQKTLSHLKRKDDTPQSFGGYDGGWCGVAVSAHLTDEYQRQQSAITSLMQGTFGQVLWSEHSWKVT